MVIRWIDATRMSVAMTGHSRRLPRQAEPEQKAEHFLTIALILQGSAKRRFPGCENFVPALAYHFCLALPAEFSQPGKRLFAGPCSIPFDRTLRQTSECTHKISKKGKGRGEIVSLRGYYPICNLSKSVRNINLAKIPNLLLANFKFK